MRTRLLGFIAAAILAALAAVAPVAQAAQAAVHGVDGQTCIDGGGSVEYESAQGSWVCVGGASGGQPIN
ncbi:hypothetical protein OG749_34445 [Streptomyces nojiriensis]|uniref:hypothetical protein n=1 Tax=Streptomyces nojiriensis TaxID=66374 RepID=UPI002E1967C2